MAIRSALDVYGENVRVLVPIDSVAHGRVMVVCVGAMMVGSTVITRQAGENVARGEELGYFKFGGSTLLLLFEEGVVNFDSDLVDNSKGPLETLVRVPSFTPCWWWTVFTNISRLCLRFVWACLWATVLIFLNSNLTCRRRQKTSL